jgi:uncharacterized lipoprotein YmbA
MTPMTPISRRACLPGLLGALLLLGACAGPALPTPQWWRLPAEAVPPAPPAAVPTREVWQLVGAVTLPGHLDRDALLVPVAGSAARLQPREAARWAEPLRDALPRLLKSDLARALGTPLWTAPLPAGVQPTRLLRLELLAFDLQPGLRGLQVQARYSLAGTGLAPRAGEIAFVQAVAADDTEALVLAHRAAIATLAQRLAAL